MSANQFSYTPDQLRDIATDTENPPTARVAAARAILAEVYRGTEVLDLAERIDRLEQSILVGTGNEQRAASA